MALSRLIDLSFLLSQPGLMVRSRKDFLAIISSPERWVQSPGRALEGLSGNGLHDLIDQIAR